MSEQQKEEGQKTVVAFIVGLIIGGLLVWAFSGTDAKSPTTNNPSEETTEKTDTSTDTNGDKKEEVKEVEKETPVIDVLPLGDGSVSIKDQTPGYTVKLDSATFPVAEGWVGVRDYVNGQLTGLLGVARFSEEQGLVPTEIVTQRATVPGREYAIVFYSENGDRQFSLADDVQLDKGVTTFMVK